MSEWIVPATVIRVVDGDTVHVKLDLGWRISLDQLVRLEGINAPELRTDAGKESLECLEYFCFPNDKVQVVSKKILGSTEKYGRVLARIRYPNGLDLSEQMLREGAAVPYGG